MKAAAAKPGRRVRLTLFSTTLAALALSFAPVIPGHTDEPGWDDEDRTYDRALRAVREGKAMPLSQAIARLRQTAPGILVATEYEYEFERWVYEFTIIDPQGNLRRVHLDARSGELVQVTDD